MEHRLKKQTTIIVDVEDKNCLAQLIVALKLNQGVRQRLYIVAGVFFFRSFFRTGKRKNMQISATSKLILCASLFYLLFFVLKQVTKENSSPAGQANAHEHSVILQMNPVIELTGRSCCCVIYEASKGAIFFVGNH